MFLRRFSVAVGLACGACAPPAGDTDAPDSGATLAGPSCGQEWPVLTPANVLGANLVAGTADETMRSDAQTLAAWLQSFEGPWEHRISGPWSVQWDGSVIGPRSTEIDRASVGDAVQGADGVWWMFYVDGDLDAMLAAAEAGTPLDGGWQGVGGLAAAVSSDGLSFERIPLSFVGDVPLLLVDPDILVLPEGGYRLYAFGVDAADVCADSIDPGRAPGAHRVWMAESADLQTWTSGGYVWSTPDPATDPTVWCDDDTCRLLMHDAGHLLAARSEDGGRTFTDDATILAPGAFVAMPDVEAVGAAWQMAYQDEGGDLRVAWSADGERWEAGSETGITGQGPTIRAEEGAVWLWMHDGVE